jgi:RND family efflux transporter MFP subunit
MTVHHCCSLARFRPTASQESRRQLNCQRLIGSIILVMACLSLGCGKKPVAPEETPPPSPVKMETRRELFFGEWTEIVGATQPMPNHVARVTANVEGHVAWLLNDPAVDPAKPVVEGQGVENGTTIDLAKPVIEGQRVEKGQIIGRLDDRIVQANFEKLQAAQREMEEQKKQADTAVELAQLNLSSLKNLVSSKKTPEDLPLASRNDLERARLAYIDAESKQKGIAAKLLSGKAELRGLEEQLKLFVLRAPISGRLGTVQAMPGQPLSLGAMVAEVTDIDEIDVLCIVSPYTAARLALDQKARIIKANEETNALYGKIVFIAVQAQPDTGAYAVKVRFPNQDMRLRSGSVVRVEVLTKPEESRICISEKAILEDQDPPGVVIIEGLETVKNKETGKDEQVGKARKLRAKIGVRDPRLKVVEIISLFDSDPESKKPVVFDEETQFVIKGGYGLQNDDVVKLEEEDE